MKEKVIFDTNIIRNAEAKNFLGGRNELERFADVADIVIPDIVIQEIKRQKRKNLQNNKQKFLDNPFHNLLEIDESNTNAFDVDDYIEKLVNDEDFTFEIIDIKDNNVLPKIKELAVDKKPPFEGRDNTDKGFKDTYIYFTILEYIQNIPDKYLFVCVKDQRFKKAFNHLPNVFAIESYEEFLNHRVSQFQDDYFLQKLEENLGFKVLRNQVKDFWINGDYNEVVLVEENGDKFVVEVDAEEIVNVAKVNDYRPVIESLVNSGNFGTTHDSIEKLEKFISFFNEKEIKQILESSYTNDQIRWIIKDEDVLSFIGLLQSYEVKLENEEVKIFLEKTFN